MQPTPTTLGTDEQPHFDKFGHEWWDPNGRLKTLHDINPIRLRYIQDHVDISKKKILDVGCGGGLLTESMALCGSLVTGIDISQHLVDIADKHARQANLNITYICATAEEFSTTYQHSYEIITCMELLEHVPDPTLIIHACRKLLKPNGLLFLSTINRSLTAYLKTKVIAEYLFRLLPVGTHEYEKYSRPSEIATWCRQVDFKVIDISGMSYIPFLRKTYLKDALDTNFLLCAKAC